MICGRCSKETNIHIMSMFSTVEICLDCKKLEEQDPAYKAARDAEEAAVRSGNYNFRGIGEPSNLRRR